MLCVLPESVGTVSASEECVVSATVLSSRGPRAQVDLISTALDCTDPVCTYISTAVHVGLHRRCLLSDDEIYVP